MKLNWAHLCDYAFMVGDKPGLVGIFSAIVAAEFPAVHPLTYLAYELGLTPEEVGRQAEVRIAVRDADGREVATANIEFRPEGTAAPGSRPSVRHIIPMPNLKFDRPDVYELAFFLNGAYAESLELQVLSPRKA